MPGAGGDLPSSRENAATPLKVHSIERFRNAISDLRAAFEWMPIELQDKPDGVLQTLHDAGNARRLFSEFGDDVRYVNERGQWMVWTERLGTSAEGARWEFDSTGAMRALARDRLEGIFAEAFSCIGDTVGKVARHASASLHLRRIDAAITLLASERGITVPAAALDADPWRISVKNGVINLRTGELEPRNKSQLITRHLDIEYDIDAQCQRWLDFLDEVQPDPNVVLFLQRAIGYSLTASTREQVLFYLFGTGANGKSVFLDILITLAGPYGVRTPVETLVMRHGGDAVPNDIAALAGKRVAVSSEIDDSHRLHEPRVKDLVGGDVVSARFMRGEFFEFRPVCKIWLHGNHKLLITGADDGIWRRIRLIEFPRQIPAADRDFDLVGKLKAELPGILRWAVQGCLLWQRDGLDAPEAIRAATNDYRSGMDIVGQFIDECCISSHELRVTFADIFAAWERWCGASNQHPGSRQRFGRRLQERGYAHLRGAKGTVYYCGIGLQTGD